MHRIPLLAFCLAASCTAQAPSSGEPDKAKPEPDKVEPAKPEPAKPDQPEPNTSNAAAVQVLGLMQTQAGLTLQIDSGGCRKNADVTFAATDNKLSIATLAPDHCEAHVPLGENLLFPWAELPAFRELGITLGAAPVLEPGSKAGATTAPAGTTDEPIYGVLVKPDGLDVRVSSGGCTDVEHFTTWIEPGETELVHLVRTTPDSCEAYLGEGELLHFTWTQLGVTKSSARLVNPIDRLVLK